MHRVLTILAAIFFGLCVGVCAANAGGSWRVFDVKGHVRAGSIEVANGAELNGDVTIETSANSGVSLLHDGATYVVGANARVHLPATGGEADVLQGSAVVRHAGSSTSETVRAATSAELSAAPLVSRGVESDAAPAPDGDVSPPTIRRQSVSTAATRPATSSLSSVSSGASSNAPTVHPAFRDHALASGLGSASGGALRNEEPRSNSEAAPSLRVSTAADIDLPSSTSGGRLQLTSEASGESGAHRTLEQQVGSAATAFAEAKHQPVVPINRQAAEQLLRTVKPNLEGGHEADGAQAVVSKAAWAMAAVIVLQLLSMGLLALWRFTRQSKSAQAQPRWRTL